MPYRARPLPTWTSTAASSPRLTPGRAHWRSASRRLLSPLPSVRCRADRAAYSVLAPPSAPVRSGAGWIIRTDPLVAAAGFRSRRRDLAGIASITTSYGQSGTAASVEHERAHRGTGVEHFLPAGPF